MRVVFMGTPDFAVPALKSILEAGYEVAAVITQPDKPKGRSGKMQYTPVKETALAAGIPVLQPVKVREEAFVTVLRELEPDVIVVVAFGQILSKAVLTLPRYGCINAHASLLPKYRGAAPVQWAVINGETESGVTTMQMNAGIDTGDMLLKTIVPLDAKETGGSLHDKLSSAGAGLLVETLKAVEEGSLQPVPQGEMTTEYAKMLDKQIGRIDFSEPAVTIERLIRGLNPWPSAYTYLDGKTLKIWAADAVADTQDTAAGMALACGTICSKDRGTFLVKTGEGCLAVTEVQLEGKKRMSASDFQRGYSLECGTVLT